MKYTTCLLACLFASGCLEAMAVEPAPASADAFVLQVPDGASLGSYFELEFPGSWRGGTGLRVDVETLGHAERLTLTPLIPYQGETLAIGWGLSWPHVEEIWSRGELQEAREHDINGSFRGYQGRIFGWDEGRIGFLVLTEQSDGLAITIRPPREFAGPRPAAETLSPTDTTPMTFTAASASYLAWGSGPVDVTDVSASGSMASARAPPSTPLHADTFSWDVETSHPSAFYMLSFSKQGERPGAQVATKWEAPGMECQASWIGALGPVGRRDDRLFTGSGDGLLRAHLEASTARTTSPMFIRLDVLSIGGDLEPLIGSAEIVYQQPPAQPGCPEGNNPASRASAISEPRLS